MISPETAAIVDDLKNHLDICTELLALVEKESQMFRRGDATGQENAGQRKALLARLTPSLARIKRHRQDWQNVDPAERTQHPEVAELLRQNQDLIMKILMLDRENEQNLLRRGLIPPGQLPSYNQQRPGFVANL